MVKKRTLLRAILTPAARRDIREILRWSEVAFGKAASLRYQSLLVQAVRDIEADGIRTDRKQRPELPTGVRLYHLATSRSRREGVNVKSPRHFLAYRTTADAIEILRVLHDSRNLAEHLAEPE